jgi:hypothetical protein
MLPHKLSSPPVRLLLTGGTLKDVRRNQHTVSAIDDVVTTNPSISRIMGRKPSFTSRATSLVSDTPS